jgi:hypothetical protein
MQQIVAKFECTPDRVYSAATALDPKNQRKKGGKFADVSRCAANMEPNHGKSVTLFDRFLKLSPSQPR